MSGHAPYADPSGRTLHLHTLATRGGHPSRDLAPTPRTQVFAARFQRIGTIAALAAVAVAGVAICGPLLGMRVPAVTLVVLAMGALAVELAPTRALETAAGVGLVALATTNKAYAVYHLFLVTALYLARRRTFALALVLGALAIAVPKHLFRAHYHQPGFYNWINEPSLALILFVTACWWREQRDGRLGASAANASLPAWAVLYLFPGHAVNPMVFGPGDLFRERRIDARGVLTALSLVALKALAHTMLWRWLPGWGYGGLDEARASSLSRATLWGIVLFNYVDLALTLSGTADLAVMLARLYGWPLASPFRFALLAWNPIELWRRWGLYNRKLLLKLVYFPLGGGTRHRLLNVMLTFLASALVLHSGWFGSKYWIVGTGGWRDESVYFALQGVAVCACLLYRQARARARGEPPDAERDSRLRWSWARLAGTAATQMTSALVHVVVLAQVLPFTSRFGLIARCLGLR
jgi:hypothetical protein